MIFMLQAIRLAEKDHSCIYHIIIYLGHKVTYLHVTAVVDVIV